MIYSDYASKFHVLMLLYGDALVLVDLNNANGTFINSVKVSNTIFGSDIIVSLATYRIKIVNAPSPNAYHTDITTTDTSKMKTLEDMHEQRNTRFPFEDIV